MTLFDWARFESKLTDIGGLCSCCCENDKWLVEDSYTEQSHNGYVTTYYTVRCKSVIIDEEGYLVGYCGLSREIEMDESPEWEYQYD